jgi:hypothetical protein
LSWFKCCVHIGSNVKGTGHSLEHAEPGVDLPAQLQR